MTGEKYLPEGRRFNSWAEVDEMPDPTLPCPACGKQWKDHAIVTGRPGRSVMHFDHRRRAAQ